MSDDEPLREVDDLFPPRAAAEGLELTDGGGRGLGDRRRAGDGGGEGLEVQPEPMTEKLIAAGVTWIDRAEVFAGLDEPLP